MAVPAFVRPGDGHIDILLRVTPNASRDAIEGVEIRDDGQARLKLRVRAVPEKGKANKAVAVLLAKALGVPKSSLAVIAGETGRDKTVRVETADIGGVLRALADLAGPT